MSDQHSSPIKTWQQLVVVVVAAFVVPVVLFAMLAALVTSGRKGEHADAKIVVERIRPVGTVVVAPPGEKSTLGSAVGPVAATSAPIVVAAIPPPAAAGAPAGKADGKNVYETACVACHGAGIAGAPKLGDKVAWAPRLAAGKDTLYAASIKGKGAMPPKGGQLQLPDDHVKAAVDYMVSATR